MQRLCKTFEICATATADGTTATITTDERQRWPESHRLCCSCKNFESESGSDVFLEIPTAQQLCARVIFVDTESQALRVRVESWLGRVESGSSHNLVESESRHFESLVCKLESMSSQMKFNIFPMSFFLWKHAQNAMKWCPCFIKFDCRLFISKFFLRKRFEFYLFISLSVIFHKSSSTLLQKIYFPCYKVNKKIYFFVIMR